MDPIDYEWYALICFWIILNFFATTLIKQDKNLEPCSVPFDDSNLHMKTLTNASTISSEVAYQSSITIEHLVKNAESSVYGCLPCVW